MTVTVTRIQDEGDDDGATRVLVDRVWPRGLRKADAPYDEWCKDAAPSSELRTWYGHDPERFDEFARRYRAELSSDETAAAGLAHLRSLADTGPVTLLTATRDVEHSHAAVLARLLRST